MLAPVQVVATASAVARSLRRVKTWGRAGSAQGSWGQQKQVQRPRQSRLESQCAVLWCPYLVVPGCSLVLCLEPPNGPTQWTAKVTQCSSHFSEAKGLS